MAQVSKANVKIAVIGSGSAGVMAAAHASEYFPERDLFHVCNSRLPTIGASAGTLPSFPPWLEAVTGLTFPVLQEQCQATLKLGVRFEKWGRAYPYIYRNVAGESFAYHLLARQTPGGAAKRDSGHDH